jgi:hypothetical protein
VTLWVRYALAVVLAASACAQSQSSAGAIQGVVIDPAGAFIADVRVSATRVASNTMRTAQTDASGQFRFSGLAIGDYTLRFEKGGFATAMTPAFTVSVGQTVMERVEMKLAHVSEKVDVLEQPDAIDTAATTTSVALGNERIEESPANNRNFLNFVLVVPGVAPSANSNTQRSAAAVRSAAVDSGFSFGGLRGRNNGLFVDGVDNRDETTGGNRVTIGLEQVQEFRVTGTSVGAEFGGAAGGIVNMVTHSGTNLWHGDGTFFAQNEFADARSPEALTSGRPVFRRWEPGASLNGPIRRDRTFFSTAIEQEWERSEEWSEVPQAAEAALNRALASPLFARAPVRRVQEGLFDESSSQTTFSFKLMHQVGATHTLSARYAFSRGRLTGDVQDGDNFLDRSARGSSLTTDHSLVVGWTDVITPHAVNDFRAQWGERVAGIAPNVRGPMLEIPGVLTFGQGYRLDQQRTEIHGEAVESVHLTLGSHILSAGASVHVVDLNSRLANRFGGLFIFPTLDDFAAGRPDVFIQAFGDPNTRIRTMPAGAFVQDHWQVRTGLSLEAGLRYDKQLLPSAIPGTNRNAAPRLGIAWRPCGTKPFVVRAAFGFFYDRYPLAFLNEAIQKDGMHGFEQYAAGSDAVRALALGFGGSLSAPLPGIALSRYIASSSFPATYSRKLTAGVERGLDKNTTLTGEFSWVEGYHLPRLRNIAGGLSPLYELEQTSRSSYEGLSISLNRRLTRELTYLVAYNLGRARDDASDFDEQPMDPANTRLDWARSRQQQLQRFSASAVFELPAEEVTVLSGWLKDSLAHIVMAPILTYGSGRPLNALATTDLFRTGAYPITARPFGLRRNPFDTPPLFSADLRLMKGFPVRGGRGILQVGVETFNLTNHTNPLRVSPYYAAGSEKLTSYGAPVETQNPRQVQFMVQLEY